MTTTIPPPVVTQFLNSSGNNNTSGAVSDRTSDDDGITYAILTFVVSLLSFAGGFGIFIFHFIYKDLRTHGRTLLVYLSVMDAAVAFGNILGVVWILCKDGPVIDSSIGYCRFNSALSIFSSISAFCWTVVMGLSLFMSIVMTKPTFTATYMKVFHLISWGLPAVVTTVALASNVLGYDHNLTKASWCWIDPTVRNAFVWQLFTGKVWEISCSLINVVLYFWVVIYIKQKAKTSLASKSNRKSKRVAIEEANRKLLFVPLVFVICRIWGTIRFLIGNFAHEYADKPELTWIAPLQGIGDSAQGFVNFVVYCCMTDRVRQRIVRSCVCCLQRDIDSTPPTVAAQTSHTLRRSAFDVRITHSSSRIANMNQIAPENKPEQEVDRKDDDVQVPYIFSQEQITQQ